MRPGNEKPGIELQGTWLAVSLPCYVPHAIKRVIGEHVLTPLRLQSCTLDTTLVGHSAPVTSAIFSPHHAHTTVVTISEDRTFKVRTLLIFVLPVSFILWVGKNTIASLSIGTGTGGLWLVGWGWSTLGTTLQLLGGIWAWVAGVKLVLFPGHIFASQTSPTFF